MTREVEVLLDGLERFDDFYRTEFGPLTGVAAAVSGDRSIAEDLAQEALRRAHDRWDRVGALDKPGAWARRVTINLALSARRRRTIDLKARLKLGARRERTLAEPGEIHDDVWQAVAELPGNQRVAIALHYLEDRSVEEIAEILECAPGTARVHLHRGRTALRESLGGQS